MQNYTEEQKKDIQERVTKAEEMLKELQLFPSAVIQKVKVGDESKDIFADNIICYLQDSKYFKND
jgi:hypothetical protein